MSSSPSLVVTTMKRASGLVVRIAAIASTPPIPGKRRSMSVTSGLLRRNNSNASSPVPAWATTVMSARALTMAAIPTRMSG